MTYATILVNLEVGRSNAHLLGVARYVADRFHAGVIGATACTAIKLIYGDTYVGGQIFEQDRIEIEKEIVEAEAEFRDAMGSRTEFVDWRSAIPVSSLADHLASEACRADLILTSAVCDELLNASRQVSVGDLVMQAGRPVLVVPPAAAPFRMDRVAVAWKNTREARRAVEDALPLLKTASQVSVIEIASADDMSAARSRLDDVAGWLGRHGVAAEIHTRPAASDDAAGLDAAADECRADVIVAGAYGHSRLREWVLGGVTRTLLRHAARPSLVSH